MSAELVTKDCFNGMNTGSAELQIPVYEMEVQGKEHWVGFEELIDRLEGRIKFRHDDDAILCLLWAAQAWLGPEVLPEKCLVYLVFVGPKSAGKTTATELIAEIAGGKFIAGGSEAAIRAVLNQRHRALGVDEVDIRIKQVPNLEGIFRVGNKWKANYPLQVPKENGGWETVEQNVGGPKVMNYRYDPEDAHATRAIVIELEPNNDADMIVRGLFGAPDLEEERTALEAGASVAKVNWGNGKMETHMKSKEFIDRVRNLDAKLPRGTQVGAVLLAISDAMGWNAEDVIKRYVSEEREDGLQTVREVLLEIYEKHEKEVRNGVLELPNKDVHPELNARLRRIGLPTVGKKEWARIRRELSIDSKREKFGVVLLFGDKARMAIGAP